jgi:hypothetical protein
LSWTYQVSPYSLAPYSICWVKVGSPGKKSTQSPLKVLAEIGPRFLSAEQRHPGKICPHLFWHSALSSKNLFSSSFSPWLWWHTHTPHFLSRGSKWSGGLDNENTPLFWTQWLDHGLVSSQAQ